MTGTPTPRPSVLVVGGGYGGINAAKALDDMADVTLVDPTEAFVHNVAAWRALVDPEWLKRIFYPYEHLLAHGRFLRDRAVAIDVTEPHFTYPLPLKVAITRLAVIGGSDACGAGTSPWMSRIHAAWRASTETILAAAARVALVRFGACEL